MPACFYLSNSYSNESENPVYDIVIANYAPLNLGCKLYHCFSSILRIILNLKFFI